MSEMPSQQFMSLFMFEMPYLQFTSELLFLDESWQFWYGSIIQVLDAVLTIHAWIVVFHAILPSCLDLCFRCHPGSSCMDLCFRCHLAIHVEYMFQMPFWKFMAVSMVIFGSMLQYLCLRYHFGGSCKDDTATNLRRQNKGDNTI